MKTFNTFAEYASHPVTEKITLATVDCKQRLYGFTQVDSGNIYKVPTSLFVCGCQNGFTSLTPVSSSGLVTASTYYFDILNSTLYVQSASGFMENGDDPEIIPTYRMFFASVPINLSWDLLDHSEQVYWEARIKDSPFFNTKLDNDQTGISVAGNGTLKLNNGDFFFKDFYDLYNFENQEVSVYSFNRTLDPSQAKIIYRGTITDKTYGSAVVSFKVKDAINALFERIPLEKYSMFTETINVTEAVMQYEKRRLYGNCFNLKVQSVDMLYDADSDEEAFTLPDSVTSVAGTSVLTGTNFHTFLTPGDRIIIGNQTVSIDNISSNTRLTISEESTASYTGLVKVIPQTSWYYSNRRFLICGHSIADVETTVITVHERNRIEVADVSGFIVGDYVDINGQHISIKRISGSKLILNQNISNPNVGDLVTKDKIQNATIRYPESKTTISLNRSDYTVDETVDGTFITLDADAEKNATAPKSLSGKFFCLNGFDVVWLGVPSIFRIDCPAHVSGSLYGKYFTVYSDKKESIIWFSEYFEADSEEQGTARPVSTLSIPSTNINYTTDTFTYSLHGLTNGTNVSFTGSLPTGITTGYGYFVRNVTTNTFQISADVNGDIKDFTSSGSGTIICTIQKDIYEVVLPSDNLTSSEVATLVGNVISDNIGTYLCFVNTNKVTLYTKLGGDISTGSVGDSGVLIYKLMQGNLSDQQVDVPTKVKSRDFVKLLGESDLSYYEVFETYDNSFRLRTSYTGVTGNYFLDIKSISYVDNESNLFIDTSGKTDASGKTMLRASDIVKDLLIEAGLEDRLDLDSFINSRQSMKYKMSLKIPDSIDDASPPLKEVIDSINQTVLGSLVLNSDLNLAYNCLDGERLTPNLPVILDDDIFEWSIKSIGSKHKGLIAKYKFSDIESLPYSEYLYTSDFATKYTDSLLTLNLQLKLYDLADVEEASQRRLYYNTLSRADIEISGGLGLYTFEMGNKLILNLKGLYNRLGNNSSNKIIGTVSSVKRSGETVDITVTTQGGGVYTRLAVITDNSFPSYDTASEDEQLYSSYIVGNNGTINNRNDLHSCNGIA